MRGKHTAGPLKVERAKRPDNTGGYDYAISDQDNCIVAECFEHVGYAGGSDKQYIIFPAAENASLIAEAFNVATETGNTPRELAKALQDCRDLRASAEAQRAELLAALKSCAETLDSAQMQSAWAFLYVHGFKWTGPTVDMKAVHAVLAKATQ